MLHFGERVKPVPHPGCAKSVGMDKDLAGCLYDTLGVLEIDQPSCPSKKLWSCHVSIKSSSIMESLRAKSKARCPTGSYQLGEGSHENVEMHHGQQHQAPNHLAVSSG